MRSILIFIYEYRKPCERRFWQRVQAYLNQLGCQVILFVRRGGGLDGDSDASYEIMAEYYARNTVNIEFTKTLHFQELIEREMLWNKVGDLSQARKGLQVVYDLYLSLIKEVDPGLIVLWNGEHASELVIRSTAEKHDIPVVFIERGPFANTYHLDDFGITASSSAAQRTDVTWGKDHDLWRDTFVRLEEIIRRQGLTWWPQPKEVSDLRKRFSIPRNHDLILFANQLDCDTSNFLFSPLHKSNLDAFSWFCDMIRKYYPNSFVIGKQHPMNRKNAADFQKAVEGIGVWTADVGLDACLKEVDRVAAVNSTALYEAMINRIPCLMFGKSILSKKNIVYEINNLEAKHVGAVASEWRAARGIEEKISRWIDLGASLISSDLYSTQDALCSSLKLRGPAEFAAQLVTRAKQKKGSNSASNAFALLNHLIMDMGSGDLVYTKTVKQNSLSSYTAKDLLHELLRRVHNRCRKLA